MIRRGAPSARKHTAEYIGDAKIKFTCITCGHCSIRKQEIGPGLFKKPMTESAILFLIKYWNKNGGCTMKCAKCHKGKK